MMRRPMAKRGERGFALLLIFAMASAMVFLLYMEMPRVLFEAQRNKEQLLIERGEQYKRAIQVYYRKTKKLPQRIEDLERGTETRFLRHRYKDPFSGKDDWKLIETDGVSLKNSLVKKPQAALNGAKTGDLGKPAEPLVQTPPMTFNSLGQPVQAPCIPGQPCEVNQALQRRASDKPAAVAGQGDQQPQTLPACDPAQPLDPTKCDPAKPWDEAAALALQRLKEDRELQQLQQGVVPGQNSVNPAQVQGQIPAPYPGQVSYPPAPGATPSPYPGQPGVPGQPGQNAFPNIPGFPGGFPGASPGGRPGSTGPFPPVGAPPVNSQAGGAGAAGAQNSALNMINQLLTTPRAGGMPGAAGAAAGMGPGIVGVATKFEGIGIKVYAEREKYQEWEFVFDPKEEKAPNVAGNQGQQPGNKNNPLGGSGSGSNNSSPMSPQPSSPAGSSSVGGFGRQR
jgi:hypothetical protein